MISKLAKIQSTKPLYKKKIKTDNGFVWVYDEKTIQKRWKEKKDKINRLHRSLRKLKTRYEKDLSSEELRIRALAAIVGIIDETAMRVGNEESARDVETYGATTLKVKHVDIKNGIADIDYVGKGGVKQSTKVKNKKIISVIKELIKNKKDNDFIFEIDGKKIWDRAVNRYLVPFNISAKDLRGFHSNRLMKEKLKSKDWEDALEEVADIVGHKPSTLKNQYLDPDLVAKYAGCVFGISKRAVYQSEDLNPQDDQQMSVPNEPFVDLNRNVSNISDGARLTPKIHLAWKVIAPFLPQGARLISGFRDAQDQENTIARYWYNTYWQNTFKDGKLVRSKLINGKAGEGYFVRNHQTPSGTDALEKMRIIMTSEYTPTQDTLAKNGPNEKLQIAKVGASDHQDGNAMDIANVKLSDIIKAVDFIKRNLSSNIVFSDIRLEGSQKNVHLSIDSVIYPGPKMMQSALRQMHYNIPQTQMYVSQSAKYPISKKALLSRENSKFIDEVKSRQKSYQSSGLQTTPSSAPTPTEVRPIVQQRGLSTRAPQKRIKPNVKTNALIDSVWNNILNYLPSNAVMTSGARTTKDQLRIIDEYWTLAGGANQYPAVEDPYEKSKILTNEYGYIVGPPTSTKPYGHLKGNAFDISGADLYAIVSGLQKAVKERGLSLKYTVEPKNNAVHVNIISDNIATASKGNDISMESIYEDLLASNAPEEVLSAFQVEQNATDTMKLTNPYLTKTITEEDMEQWKKEWPGITKEQILESIRRDEEREEQAKLDFEAMRRALRRQRITVRVPQNNPIDECYMCANPIFADEKTETVDVGGFKKTICEQCYAAKSFKPDYHIVPKKEVIKTEPIPTETWVYEDDANDKYEEEKDDPKWNEVLIDSNKKLTRKEIRSHYDKNVDNILKEIKGKPVMLYIGTGKNKNILKRNHNDKPIIINNKEELMYWADRRMLSIHRVFDKQTDMGFVDLDLHGDYPISSAKKYATKISEMIKEKFGVKTDVYSSGGTGLHIEFLLKEKMNVDDLRDKLKSMCEELNKNFDGATTGIVKGSGMRTDVTTLKENGNLRVPSAIHESDGGVKELISVVKKAFISKRAEEEKPEVNIPVEQKLNELAGFGLEDNMGDWFEKSPRFVERKQAPDFEIHDVNEGTASQLSETDPEKFFYRGLHKDFPQFEARALKSMIKDNPKFYFVFKYHTKEEPQFKELLQSAAEALSLQDVRAFFYYKLHHSLPELGRGAIIQLIDTNPDSFFDLGLDKDYPDYVESANNARNIKDPNKVEIELDQLEQITASSKKISKRAGEEIKIVLDAEEKKIFDLLQDVASHYKLPVELRCAGGWLRDKILASNAWSK